MRKKDTLKVFWAKASEVFSDTPLEDIRRRHLEPETEDGSPDKELDTLFEMNENDLSPREVYAELPLRDTDTREFTGIVADED